MFSICMFYMSELWVCIQCIRSICMIIWLYTTLKRKNNCLNAYLAVQIYCILWKSIFGVRMWVWVCRQALVINEHSTQCFQSENKTDEWLLLFMNLMIDICMPLHVVVVVAGIFLCILPLMLTLLSIRCKQSYGFQMCLLSKMH